MEEAQSPGVIRPWAFCMVHGLHGSEPVLGFESTGQRAHRKFTMPFISEKNRAAAIGGSGGYLNPAKIPAGSFVRFAILSEQPLEFFECWGEDANKRPMPFRFVEDPSPRDIALEMGENYTRRLDRDGTGPEKVKFAMAVPVYNYDNESVEILSLTQKTLQQELDDISQMEDYQNLLDWDFILGRTGLLLETKYTLRPVPRKKGSNPVLREAWNDALSRGFDVTRLLDGGNPFTGPADSTKDDVENTPL